MMSLPNDAGSIQQNYDLMQEFTKALEDNPAADLLDLIPGSYMRSHQNAYLRSLKSDAAKLNHRTLNELRIELRDDPEVDLLSAFPTNYYTRSLRLASKTKEKAELEIEKPLPPPDFRKWLDIGDSVEIVFPLSNAVNAMMGQYGDISAESLRTMLWSAPKLWENPIRGVVIKCSDSLVAKVVTSSGDYTEYTALRLRSIRKEAFDGVQRHNIPVTTAEQLDNAKRSTLHHGSTTYLSFLRSFPTESVQDLVFTHGDIRQDNIIVRMRILRIVLDAHYALAG
ncbi:hypothetical protein MW887_007638 [Aspergillus wentii]|nr:hypothetical protein MW887_007638 [Aspergillus wentii]